MSRWPRDNQAELIAFYGNPGVSGPKGVVAQLVRVTPPFQMYYDGRPLKSISFHRKAAPALMAALNEIWRHYGRDQRVIDKLGISKCGGTYNPRKVRGSKTKWSNHAFGAAIDLNAEENGFNAKSTIPLPVIAAFKRQGFRWGGDYRTRKDPMHFEACDGGNIAASTPLGLIDMPEADSHDEEPVADGDLVPPVDEAAGVSDVETAADLKPMRKSKIGWMQQILGFLGLGGAASAVDDSAQEMMQNAWSHADKTGLLGILQHALHKPMFWIFLAIAVGAALTFYWRMRDYGRGARR